MEAWVLIVYIGSSGLYLPITSHRTEAACHQALEEWVFAEPGARGTCLPGTVEPERKRKSKWRGN